MTLPTIQGLVVDAIPLAPPRVSLLSSVDVIEGGDTRWLNGISWMPEACGPPDNPYWWVCPLGDGDDPKTYYEAQRGTGNGYKTAPTPEAELAYLPFDIWVGVQCGNMAQRTGEKEQEARRALAAFQSFLIEQELWTGTIATAAGFPNDYLENSPTAINSGNLTPYVTALAELEQALATCQPGQIGVIHAQPRTVSVWKSADLVAAEPNGRRLRTELGTIVVPGAGYPGTGNGLDPATMAASYAYGTGMVQVRLGPVEIIDEFDHTLNTRVVRAERAAAATWDECCQVAVQVDLNTAV